MEWLGIPLPGKADDFFFADRDCAQPEYLSGSEILPIFSVAHDLRCYRDGRAAPGAGCAGAALSGFDGRRGGVVGSDYGPKNCQRIAVGVVGRGGVADDQGGSTGGRVGPVGVQTLQGETISGCCADGVVLAHAGREADEGMEPRRNALDLAGAEHSDEAVAAVTVGETAPADVTVVGAGGYEFSEGQLVQDGALAVGEELGAGEVKFGLEAPLPTVRFENLALVSTRSADNTGVRVQVLRRQPDGSWMRIIDRPEVPQR